jgi:hypothetical protein
MEIASTAGEIHPEKIPIITVLDRKEMCDYGKVLFPRSGCRAGQGPSMQGECRPRRVSQFESAKARRFAASIPA